MSVAPAAQKESAPNLLERLTAQVAQGPTAAALFFACFMAVALFYVWSHVQVVKATYDLGALQKQLDAQIERNDKLHLEIRTLRAPNRLAGVAASQLGLAAPREGQVILVQSRPTAQIEPEVSKVVSAK